jgi:hypothetical protein
MNIKRFQAGIFAAKKILEDYPEGGANEIAKKEMLDACNAMEWSLDEGDYFIEKIGDIRIAAQSFFSARKHFRLKQNSSSGIQVLHSQISSLLNRTENYSADLQKEENQSSVKT